MARKGGNPNIGEIAKTHSTGPKTKEGKLRTAQNLPLSFNTGKMSKLLAQQREGGCDKCSLGVVKKTKIVNGKKMEIETLPICKFYKKGSKVCKLPLDDMAFYMKNYNSIFSGNEEHALKTLIVDLLKDAKNAEIVEVMEKGKTAYYTLENKKAAGSLMTDLIKLKTPVKTENKNLNLNLDVGEYVSMDDILGDDE